MNFTGNYTDIGDIVGSGSLEEEVPFLEDVDVEPESDHELSFIENSLLKIIPKFFKALVTLLICGLLLGVTFLLINLWKRGCRTHRKLEEDTKSSKKKGGGTPLHSVIVTPPEDDDDYIDIDDVAGASTSGVTPQKTKGAMKVPKQALLRRASGPFGSDALMFVGEQYTMKNIEKERHHHVEGRTSPHGGHGHGHGHHGPPHFHSGHSSAGGGSHGEGEKGEGVKGWFKKGKTSPA